jgi:hypothetical protein
MVKSLEGTCRDWTAIYKKDKYRTGDTHTTHEHDLRKRTIIASMERYPSYPYRTIKFQHSTGLCPGGGTVHDKDMGSQEKNLSIPKPAVSLSQSEIRLHLLRRKLQWNLVFRYRYIVERAIERSKVRRKNEFNRKHGIKKVKKYGKIDMGGLGEV